MPRVNLFFSQDEYRELEKKAALQGQKVYGYLKDMALNDIKDKEIGNLNAN